MRFGMPPEIMARYAVALLDDRGRVLAGNLQSPSAVLRLLPWSPQPLEHEVPVSPVGNGLILGYLSITLPFSMWLMWAFLRSVPLEVEEAALIDGATRLQVFRLIVLPLALPGIIATSIFSFIVAWNDYLIARIFMNSITQLPLTVGVMHFFEGVHVDWGLMMAAAVLMTLPLAILFMLVQRHLIVGFGAGAVKG